MSGSSPEKITPEIRPLKGWRGTLPVVVFRDRERWRIRVFPLRLGVWTALLLVFGYVAGGTALFLNDRHRNNLDGISWWDRVYPPKWAVYSTARGEAYIRLAQISVEKGNLAKAIHQLRVGLARSPSNSQGRILLSDIYLFAQRPDLAQATLLEGLNHLSSDTNADDLIKRAITFLSEHQEDEEIIRSSDKLLRSPDTGPEARRFLALARAHAYFYRGNFDQAEDCLRKFDLQLTIDGRLLSARIEWDRGFKELALVLINQLAKENSANQDIYRLRVKWLLEDQQIDQARQLSLLRRVTFPDLIQPRLDLLYALDRVGDKQAVREESDLFIRAFPDQLNALIMLGDFAANTGNVDIAQRVFEQAASKNLAVEGLALMRVESRIVSGNYRAAIEDVRALLKENPAWEEQMAPVFNGLQAIAYFALGDRESADLYLNNFLERGQTRAENLVAVSKRLSDVGAKNQALLVLARAVQEDPFNQLALTSLVEFELNASESSGLAEHLPRLLRMRRPSPTLLKSAYEVLGKDRFVFLPNREEILDQVTLVLSGKSPNSI